MMMLRLSARTIIPVPFHCTVVPHASNTLCSLTTALCHSNRILVTRQPLPPHTTKPSIIASGPHSALRCAAVLANSSHYCRRTDLTERSLFCAHALLHDAAVVVMPTRTESARRRYGTGCCASIE